MILISLLYLACWSKYYYHNEYVGGRYELGFLLLMLFCLGHVVIKLLNWAAELIDI